MSQSIELFVGGKKFETTRETLEKLEYFRIRLSDRWTNTGPLKLDRDPKAFRALLNYLRDPNYKLPEKYLPELQFFDPVSLPSISHVDHAELLGLEISSKSLPNPLYMFALNRQSKLLHQYLPEIVSKFIDPLQPTWEVEHTVNLTIRDQSVHFDLLNFINMHILTTAELYFKPKDGVKYVQFSQVVHSMILYRGKIQVNELNGPELEAIHTIFDGRKYVMRIYDLFGNNTSRIQTAQTTHAHFADLRRISWKLNVDAEAIEAIYLRVVGQLSNQTSVDLFDAYGPFGQIPSPPMEPNYQFDIFFPLLASTELQSTFGLCKLHRRDGVLYGLIVMVRSEDLPCNLPLIELYSNEILMHSHSNGKNIGGVYHIELPGLFDSIRSDLNLKIHGVFDDSYTFVIVGKYRFHNLLDSRKGLCMDTLTYPYFWV